MSEHRIGRMVEGRTSAFTLITFCSCPLHEDSIIIADSPQRIFHLISVLHELARLSRQRQSIVSLRPLRSCHKAMSLEWADQVYVAGCTVESVVSTDDILVHVVIKNDHRPAVLSMSLENCVSVVISICSTFSIPVAGTALLRLGLSAVHEVVMMAF